MNKRLRLASLALALGTTLAVPGISQAQSATPVYQNSESEAQRRSGGNEGIGELFSMIQRMQNEIRQLRGTVEEQQNQLDRLSRQSRERYVDLDQRILDVSDRMREAEASRERSASASAEPEKRIQPVAREYRQPTEAEKQDYAEIQKLIREDKDYDAAIDALYEFISEYPEGDLTVNAYYWLGEVYLVKPQYEQARQAFSIVATRYADHRKAADALYKLGVALDELDEDDDARRRMEQVIEDYPGTKAASLAEVFLESR